MRITICEYCRNGGIYNESIRTYLIPTGKRTLIEYNICDKHASELFLKALNISMPDDARRYEFIEQASNLIKAEIET